MFLSKETRKNNSDLANSPGPCLSLEDPISKMTHKYVGQDYFFPFYCKNHITECLKVMAEKIICTSRLIVILVHVQDQPPPGLLPEQGHGWGWGIPPAWLMAPPLKSTIRKMGSEGRGRGKPRGQVSPKSA